jgi:hypothetical protein
MLRLFVLLLLLANALYLVWTQGLLAPYGFAPASQAEPERLGQQIRPEAIKLIEAEPAQPAASAASVPLAPGSAVLAPGFSASVPVPAAVPASASPVSAASSASAASAAASPVSAAVFAAAVPISAPGVSAALAPVILRTPEPDSAPEPAEPHCLQAGLFTEFQANAMRPRLQAALPAGSWLFAGTGKSVRWIVYMGKYASKDVMNKKRILLEQAGVPSDLSASPLLSPGLSLGSFKPKAQAEAALVTFAEHGIRTAKVIQERPELPTQWLRLPAPSPALQAKAKTLIPKISGKRLQPCG